MNSTPNTSTTTKITKNSKSTPVSEFGRDLLNQNTFSLLMVVQPQLHSLTGQIELTTMPQFRAAVAVAVEAAAVVA